MGQAEDEPRREATEACADTYITHTSILQHIQTHMHIHKQKNTHKRMNEYIIHVFIYTERVVSKMKVWSERVNKQAAR